MLETRDKPIVLTTDFKDTQYVGIMRGVILNYNPKAIIVDLSHNITPFSIVEASYILYTSYKYFPQNSIFVAVVDPDIGTERDVLITAYHNYLFVSPDNGLLSPFFLKDNTIKFTNFERLKLGVSINTSFQGIDVLASIGAILSLNEEMTTLGIPKEDPKIIKWWQLTQRNKNFLEGKVVHIDSFGNVVTNIPCKYVKSILEVQIKNTTLKENFTSYRYAPYDTPFFYCGSSGFVELALREKNFAKEYSISLLTPLLCKITPI